MPRGPQGQKRPADAIGAAIMVAKIATGEITETLISKSGRTRSGLAGGNARAQVIPRTTIPLYRVSALLGGGMRIDQVLEDFPSLTAEQVEYARAYAAIYPNLGKPYPKTSFKRLLRNAGFYAAQNSQVVKKTKDRQ